MVISLSHTCLVNNYMLVYLMVGLSVVAFVLSALSIMELLQFRRGIDNHHRVCRHCGAHQFLNIPDPNNTATAYWSEYFPYGSNPKCACHRFASNHRNG